MPHEAIVPENPPESILRETGYSLWIVPDGKEFQAFNVLIKKLAQKLNAPLFAPHITILGGIHLKEKDIPGKMKQLASTQEPFYIELNGIGYEEVWNRTLFIKAEESPMLTNLFNNSRTIFESGNFPPFPHMSIAYGAFPEKSKEDVIKEINNNYPPKFEVSSLHLFTTDGLVQQWKKIEEIPLIK